MQIIINNCNFKIVQINNNISNTHLQPLMVRMKNNNNNYKMKTEGGLFLNLFRPKLILKDINLKNFNNKMMMALIVKIIKIIIRNNNNNLLLICKIIM